MTTSCNLSDCPIGSEVIIKSMDLSPEIILRMAEMGITNTCPLKVINNRSSCPMIVECKQVQFALHRKIVEKIIVKNGDIDEYT